MGIPKDVALMDEDAKLIVCEMTSTCVAMNNQGWMKHTLDPSAVPPPDKSKKLFIRVPSDASESQLQSIRSFFTQFFNKLPDTAKKLNQT